MLSNAYFLAKFRFDTAENEPAKNLQNFRKMHFRKILPAVFYSALPGLGPQDQHPSPAGRGSIPVDPDRVVGQQVRPQALDVQANMARLGSELKR